MVDPCPCMLPIESAQEKLEFPGIMKPGLATSIGPHSTRLSAPALEGTDN
jgi:hypothetical protein